jgi:mRNA interferase YafQ
MKHLSQTKQFSKDIKRMARRGKDVEKLKAVVRLLAEGRSLDPRHRDHPLSGQWNQSRDCHIEADWILIYFSDPTSLRLERTGTHSDLFE